MAKKKTVRKAKQGTGDDGKTITVRLSLDELEQLDELTALLQDGKRLGKVSRSDVIRAIFGWATPQALKDPSILES